MSNTLNFDHSVKLKEALWKSIDQQPGEGCWLWTGSASGGVYPRVYWNGHLLSATREVYRMVMDKELTRKDFLSNQCGHPLCVRPSHYRIQAHPRWVKAEVTPLSARERKHSFGELRAFLQRELERYEVEVSTAMTGYPMDRSYGRLLGMTMALADVVSYLEAGQTAEEHLTALQRKWFDHAADLLSLAMNNQDQHQGYREINIGLALREAGQEAKRLLPAEQETAQEALLSA